MKEIIIRGKSAYMDDEVYEVLKGAKFGMSKEGYISVSFKLHNYVLGFPNSEVIDHINHKPFDNRKENLRACTISENSRNKRLMTYNKILL